MKNLQFFTKKTPKNWCFLTLNLLNGGSSLCSRSLQWVLKAFWSIFDQKVTNFVQNLDKICWKKSQKFSQFYDLKFENFAKNSLNFPLSVIPFSSRKRDLQLSRKVQNRKWAKKSLVFLASNFHQIWCNFANCKHPIAKGNLGNRISLEILSLQLTQEDFVFLRVIFFENYWNSKNFYQIWSKPPLGFGSYLI